jgi:hypothetical protein
MFLSTVQGVLLFQSLMAHIAVNEMSLSGLGPINELPDTCFASESVNALPSTPL